MTPEQRFARLRDESLWSEVRVPRGRRLESSKQPWYLQFVVPIVGAAVAAALVMTGVNVLRDASVLQPAAIVPTSTSTPTPSPSPTEVDVTSNAWTSPPEIAFGGDCSKVISVEVASKYLGAPTTGPDTLDLTDSELPFKAVLRHNGGIDCWWTGHIPDISTDSAPTPRLHLEIVPVDGLEKGHQLNCRPNGCFDINPNGYQIVGTIFDGLASGLDFTPLYEATAAAQPIPGAWARRDGDWPASVECGELGSLGTVVSAKPSGPMESLDYPLAVGHGNTRCSFTQNGEKGVIDILSGGAWLKSEVNQMAGVESVAIEGADSAFVDAASSTLYVFSGQNYFTIKGDMDVISAAVPKIITSLDSIP